MKNEISGLCLIINNEEFKTYVTANNEEIRTGSNRDVERLEQLFKKLNFQVEIKRNRSKDEMLKSDFVELIKRIKRNDTKFDAMVLVIMSHGKKDVIYDRDNKKIEVIIYYN